MEHKYLQHRKQRMKAAINTEAEEEDKYTEFEIRVEAEKVAKNATQL